MGIVVEIKNIIPLIKDLKKQGLKIVTTNGCFDILHVGHIRYLQKTKTFADYSIVLLNSDISVKKIKGENRPINSELDRAEVLDSLKFVDYVVLFDEESPKFLLDEIKPDVYTKGADYTLETLPERDVVLENNIRVEFIEFVEGKSTTNLINRINSK